jgi:hypothetical protein
MLLEELTVDAFSDKVGHVFVIEEPDHPAIELTLTEISPLRNYAKLKREPFSLFFTSQGNAVLPQRMYALRHAVLGRHSIFLVPIAGNNESVTYQAVFS